MSLLNVKCSLCFEAKVQPCHKTCIFVFVFWTQHKIDCKVNTPNDMLLNNVFLVSILTYKPLFLSLK